MRVLTVLLSIALLVPAAWAEDPFAPEPPKLPFSLEDIAPEGDATPEGWKKHEGEIPSDAPTEEALLAIAKASGVSEGASKARTLAFTKGEGEGAKTVVAAWITIDVGSDEILTKVTDGIEEKGWLIKEVAVPQRLLVAWAAEMGDARALLSWQAEQAVLSLCTKGWALMEAGAKDYDQTARQQKMAQGQMMIGAGLETEPAAGIANAMVSALLVQADAARALAHSRKALVKDAPAQAPDKWIAQAASIAGGGLLTKEDKSVLDEALAALLRGVAAEESAAEPYTRFGNRYNLSCAYARLGKLDEAFEHLEESLRFLKEAWEEDKKKSFSGFSQLQYPTNFEWAKVKDTDMGPLRNDPRWKPLMAKYDPTPKPEKPEEPKKADEKKEGAK